MRPARTILLGLLSMLLTGAAETSPPTLAPEDAALVSVKIVRGGDTPRYTTNDGYSYAFQDRPFLEVRFATALNLPEIEHAGRMLQPQAAFCSDLSETVAAKGRSIEWRSRLLTPDIEVAPWVDADIDWASFSKIAELSAALAEWSKGKWPLTHRFYLVAKAGDSTWGYAVTRPYDLMNRPTDVCFAVTTMWPGSDGHDRLLTKIVTIPKELIAGAVEKDKRRASTVRFASNETSPQNH